MASSPVYSPRPPSTGGEPQKRPRKQPGATCLASPDSPTCAGPLTSEPAVPNASPSLRGARRWSPGPRPPVCGQTRKGPLWPLRNSAGRATCGAHPLAGANTRGTRPPRTLKAGAFLPALPGRTRVLRPHSATRQTEEAPGPLGTPLSPMSSSHGAANSGLRPPLPCPWEEFRGIKGAGQSVHRVPETLGPRAEWPRTGPSGPSPPRADVTARATPVLGSVLHLLLHSEPPHRYMLSHPPLTGEET